MKSILVLLIVGIGAGNALFFSKNSGPEWNSLRTTWGPNPMSPNSFVRQPLTAADAKKEGFHQIANGCQGQSKFLGQRFVKDRDVSLVLIYDTHGNLAGIQQGIPKAIVTEKHYKYSQQKMYNQDTIDGTDVYILTAYFIDPKNICQASAQKTRPKSDAVGTGLWLQNGPDSIRDSFAVPLEQSQLNETKWVQGACFPSMGVHQWYDNRPDSDCTTYFPVFLLFNKKTLTGFGWVVFGKFEYTNHTEFPPLAVVQSFLKPVPTCIPQFFEDVGGFTTMHIYFNAEPLNLLC